MICFRVFVASASLSNLLYFSGIFHFWEGWMAPIHTLIYAAVCLEANHWIVLGEFELREKKRLRNFALGVGMILGGVYYFRSENPSTESVTSIFLCACLFALLADVEESRWLLRTAFGNHATLLFVWFFFNASTNLLPAAWVTASAWKLIGHAGCSILWLIVVGYLPHSTHRGDARSDGPYRAVLPSRR